MARQTISLSLAPILFLVITTLAGCAGIQSTERRLLVSGIRYEVPEPGTVAETLEEAAIAALVHARTTASPIERQALLIGSIVRVESGYAWHEPRRSESYFQSARKPVARLAPNRDHVATYVVHPRTGNSRLDRLNEDFTKSEKALVDRADPLHRPIFLLTPRGRMLSYAGDAPSVEIAALRSGRVLRRSTTEVRTVATNLESSNALAAGEGTR
jgi:hypothetical protein